MNDAPKMKIYSARRKMTGRVGRYPIGIPAGAEIVSVYFEVTDKLVDSENRIVDWNARFVGGLSNVLCVGRSGRTRYKGYCLFIPESFVPLSLIRNFSVDDIVTKDEKLDETTDITGIEVYCRSPVESGEIQFRCVFKV